MLSLCERSWITRVQSRRVSYVVDFTSGTYLAS